MLSSFASVMPYLGLLCCIAAIDVPTNYVKPLSHWNFEQVLGSKSSPRISRQGSIFQLAALLGGVLRPMVCSLPKPGPNLGKSSYQSGKFSILIFLPLCLALRHPPCWFCQLFDRRTGVPKTRGNELPTDQTIFERESGFHLSRCKRRCIVLLRSAFSHEQASIIRYATAAIPATVFDVSDSDKHKIFFAYKPALPHLLLFSLHSKPSSLFKVSYLIIYVCCLFVFIRLKYFQSLAVQYSDKIVFGLVHESNEALSSVYGVTSFSRLLSVFESSSPDSPTPLPVIHYGAGDMQGLIETISKIAEGVSQELVEQVREEEFRQRLLDGWKSVNHFAELAE